MIGSADRSAASDDVSIGQMCGRGQVAQSSHLGQGFGFHRSLLGIGAKLPAIVISPGGPMGQVVVIGRILGLDLYVSDRTGASNMRPQPLAV